MLKTALKSTVKIQSIMHFSLKIQNLFHLPTVRFVLNLKSLEEEVNFVTLSCLDNPVTLQLVVVVLVPIFGV